MVVCVYDNPDTFHRECWQDKKLIYSYSVMLLSLHEKIIKPTIFFGANIGDWKPGQLAGDKEAIGDK